jgi:hypothetical protein
MLLTLCESGCGATGRGDARLARSAALVPATEAIAPVSRPVERHARLNDTIEFPSTPSLLASSSRLIEGFEPPIASHAWKYIVLHHSAGDEGSVASIDADHRQRTDRAGRHWLGIGYHFVIGNGQGMPDGLIEPTFRWREQLHGAHAGSHEYNRDGIGICLVGDFSQSPPSDRQVAAARQLIGWLSARYSIDAKHVLRHGDVAASDCPGRFFPAELLVSARQSGVAQYDPYTTPRRVGRR